MERLKTFCTFGKSATSVGWNENRILLWTIFANRSPRHTACGNRSVVFEWHSRDGLHHLRAIFDRASTVI